MNSEKAHDFQIPFKRIKGQTTKTVHLPDWVDRLFGICEVII